MARTASNPLPFPVLPCPCLQVFGVTLDPFIVYSSNMFAILSLRGLYGFVSGVMGQVGQDRAG